MEKKTIRIITIGAIMATILALSISPAFACGIQRRSFTNVVVKTGDLWEKDGYFPVPVTFDAKAEGFNKILCGTGTLHDPLFCGDSRIVLAGSIKGNTLTLSGWIFWTERVPDLKGTKVKLVAEAGCKLGDVSLTLVFPKVEGWELSGMTFVFVGEGTVSIR